MTDEEPTLGKMTEAEEIFSPEKKLQAKNLLESLIISGGDISKVKSPDSKTSERKVK